MRVFFTAAAIAAIVMINVPAAQAQRASGSGGKQSTPDDPRKAQVDAEKRLANERAYQEALKRIPASTEKADPWKGAR